MINREEWTCSSTPESWCSVPEETRVYLSSRTCRSSRKTARCARKASFCSKEFCRGKGAKTSDNRERSDDSLHVPGVGECRHCNEKFPRECRDKCSAQHYALCPVPGDGVAAERISDTTRVSIGGGRRANTGGREYFEGPPSPDRENHPRGCGQKHAFDCVLHFTLDPPSYPNSAAVEVGRCGTPRRGVEELCGREGRGGKVHEIGGGGRSFPCGRLKEEPNKKTHRTMSSLSSFHKKWRLCSLVFYVLLTAVASAHPLIGHPGHSATLIVKPFVRHSNFTPATPPAAPDLVSSAPADHASAAQPSARRTPASGLRSGTGNEIPSRDPKSRGGENEDRGGPGTGHPDAVLWGARGVVGSGAGDPRAEEDFDEAVRRAPTPEEAERISRFNASGYSWSMLTEAVSQLVQEVAQRRWSNHTTSQLANRTSVALHHNLTEHQLRQLGERGFSSVDFSALQAEISRSLPAAGRGGDPPRGEREGRSFSSRLPRFFLNLGRMLDLETVINEVETSIMTSVSCNACKGGVGLLQHYIEQGNTKEDIVRAASKLCTNFRVETPRVCFGILHLMADEVVYVMQNLVMQPDGICGFLIGDVCGIPPDPYHKWRVLFPPYPKPPIQLIKPPKEDTPTYKVLHLSDTHYDPYYLEGSNAECNEPMCCRATSGVPASDRAKAGKWGDYRKCDTPRRTIVSMYEHIARVHPDVDYIIWTGDLPPHDIWNQTRESNLLVLRETVEQLKTFFPGVPVFPALGNHESAPVNSFPPPSIPPQHSVQWLYDDLMVQWLKWLPPHTAPTIQKGGYYSVLLAPGFRIISLNMNFCNNKNWWLLLDSEDPADQLQWLVYELQAAELKGEKVHILGHIPPGYHDCLKVWSRNFYTVVNRYEATIAAQFYGHTHYDELEVFYDDDDVKRPTSIAYVGPSITTYPDLNPGYRVYWVERDAREGAHRVVDHETWIMDLDKANDPRNAEVDPHWYKLYSAREAYEMRSLLPVDWDNLVYRMVEDQELFDTFYRHYWKNSPKRAPCDAECKKRLLCDLKSGRSNDRKKTCAVVHERVEAQERSQWRSWLYSGLTLTSLATLFVLL